MSLCVPLIVIYLSVGLNRRLRDDREKQVKAEQEKLEKEAEDEQRRQAEQERREERDKIEAEIRPVLFFIRPCVCQFIHHNVSITIVLCEPVFPSMSGYEMLKYFLAKSSRFRD